MSSKTQSFGYDDPEDGVVFSESFDSHPWGRRIVNLRHVERWVYFIRAGDSAIKIGSAASVTGRLGELQVGNHEELTLLLAVRIELLTERGLHERFAHLRIRGEWFRAAPELLEFIEHARARSGAVDTE